MKPAEQDTPPQESDEVRRGRLQVRAIMVSLLGYVGMATLMGSMPPAGAVFWLALFGVLWLWIGKRRVWARWATLVLIVVFAVGNVKQAFDTFDGALGMWAVNAALVVLFVWCGFVLGMSPKISAYLASPPS